MREHERRRFFLSQSTTPSQIVAASQSVTPSQPSSSAFKRLVKHYPLTTYFVIAFAGAWLFVLPLVFSRSGLGLLAFTFPVALLAPYLTLGGLAGPGLGAFLVTGILDGKSGVKRLLRRYVRVRVGFQWYLLIVVAQPLVFLFALCAWVGSAPLVTLFHNWMLIIPNYLLLVPIFMVLGGPLGEEAGWRGFALPHLQERYGPILASLMLGFIWGMWHLPGFFGGWLGAFTWPVFIGEMLAGMASSLLLTWIYNHTRASMFLAILFHAASNASISLLSKLIPVDFPHGGFVAFVLLSNGVGVTAYGICALLLLLLTRGRLASTTLYDLSIAVQPTISNGKTKEGVSENG